MNRPGITTTPVGDIIADTEQMDWLEVGGGTRFKVLRACEETGQWALYVNMEPGARFQAHRHEGPGQYFVTKGELIYDRSHERAEPSTLAGKILRESNRIWTQLTSSRAYPE